MEIVSHAALAVRRKPGRVCSRAQKTIRKQVPNCENWERVHIAQNICNLFILKDISFLEMQESSQIPPPRVVLFEVSNSHVDTRAASLN